MTLWLSPRTVRMFDWLHARLEGRGRRRELPPPSCGTQFSLSESPEGERIKPSLPMPDVSCSRFELDLAVPCSLARLDVALPNLGFLPSLLKSWLRVDAFLLFAFGFKAELLVDRMRLMAAIAEPLDSFSACSVRASRASESQQDSHVRASFERPVGRWGNGVSAFLIDGRENKSALWLLWSVPILLWGENDVGDEPGQGACWCGGEGELVTSSAFPSRESDSRIDDWVKTLSSIRSGHDAGWLGLNLAIWLARTNFKNEELLT